MNPSGYAWIFLYELSLSHLSPSYCTVCSATALSQSKEKPYSLLSSRLASSRPVCCKNRIVCL